MENYNYITFNEAIKTDYNDLKVDFVIGTLQVGDVGMIVGADGIGKSIISLLFAVSVAFSIPACNVVDKPQHSGRVLIFAGEDRRKDHVRRLKYLCEFLKEEYGIDSDDDGHLAILPLEGHRMPLFAKVNDKYTVTEHGLKFIEMIKDYRLVILDPLRMFHDLTESDGYGMDAFVRWLITVALSNQCAIIVVHHASQDAILNSRTDQHAGRGSTDFVAACRAVWVLRSITEKEAAKMHINIDERRDYRLLYNAKANHDKEDNFRLLKRHNSLWIHSDKWIQSNKEKGDDNVKHKIKQKIDPWTI